MALVLLLNGLGQSLRSCIQSRRQSTKIRMFHKGMKRRAHLCGCQTVL